MRASILDDVKVTVPARIASQAWLNAMLASSKEPSRPLICQTLSVEVFETKGVQFIATNGHVLFRTWAPVNGSRTWPAMRYRPDRQLTVMDPDGFGLGFMRALLRVTSEETHVDEQLTITSAPVDDEAAPSFGAEFQTERVTLRACGQRLDLLVRDEPYPDWRKLKLGLDEMAFVDGMKVQPKYLGLVGRLKDITAVDMTFAGNDRAIWIDANGEQGYGVKGLLMPMRRLETGTKDEPETALDENDDDVNDQVGDEDRG